MFYKFVEKQRFFISIFDFINQVCLYAKWKQITLNKIMINPLKFINCILCFLIVAHNLQAQCPQGNETVKLEGQAEVDEFLLQNPSCTFIEELELTGDVTDISGFSTLTTLNYLYFENCPLLTELSAFINVDTIYENLGFYNTMGFVDLCGLNNLVYIGDDLRLEETEGIRSLVGLERLNTIADDITIFGNVDLENIENLETVISFGDDPLEKHNIGLRDNPKLSDCCGIQSLYEQFPQFNWVIENNAPNCNSLMEIENLDCNISPILCTTNSTNDTGLSYITVSPNPCSDFIELINPLGRSINKISLIGLDGRLVSEFDINSSRLDLAAVNAGIYLLRLRIDDVYKVSKIVVSK